jgi:hypothetical protein
MKTKTLNLARVAFMAALLVMAASLRSLGQSLALEHCQIQSVDRTNMTITVKQVDTDQVLTLYVTSQTRLFRNGEPAVTSDLLIGDMRGGPIRRNADNKVEAIRFT